MTGEEYIHLIEGDLCKLSEDIDTNNLRWHKGDIVEVIYARQDNDNIYVRNFTTKWGDRPSYKVLGPLWFFKAMELYKKWNEVKKNTFVTRFGHRFMPGNEVWFMKDNKPFKDIISRVALNITRSKGIEWYYCGIESGHIGNDTAEIYSTKDELINSLR